MTDNTPSSSDGDELAHGDELAQKSGWRIFDVEGNDLRAEQFTNLLEDREARVYRVLLDFSLMKIALYAFYDEEGDQAMFSVRFGIDRVVPAERRDQAKNLLYALDNELYGGHLYLAPDGAIVLRDHLKAPLEFIRPGLYRETIRQIIFDAARLVRSIETLLAAAESSERFVDAFGAIAKAMGLDPDSIDDTIATTDLEAFDTIGIYSREYIIRRAIELLGEQPDDEQPDDEQPDDEQPDE